MGVCQSGDREVTKGDRTYVLRHDDRDSESEDEQGKSKCDKFQVKLGGRWKDYNKKEDKILKRAYMAGFPCAEFKLRGQTYHYDFDQMLQCNEDTGKDREIRPPRRWRRPKKPLVPPGQTTVVNVQKGWAGRQVLVPHPLVKGAFITVAVPKTAKVGQAMLIPVPEDKAVSASGAPLKPEKASAGKVAGGAAAGAAIAVAGGAAVAGAVVGGAILGEHVAEHGVDATMDAAGDGLETAADAVLDVAEEGAEAIEDFAIDAGEFMIDAADDVGDFVMDLF